MAAFSEIDKRLREDEKLLHDFLWQPGWKGDSKNLIENLVRDAKDLDVFLNAGGKLFRPAEALARELSAGKKEGSGESLFEMLSHAFFLTAATEDLKRGDFESVGKRLQEVVGSVTIGVCANAGRFDYVQEWEGGKVDFETYTGKLAAVLQDKGVKRAAEWTRMVQAAYDSGAGLNLRSGVEGELLAKASVLNACWVTAAALSIRETIGSPPRFPPENYAVVLREISRRV